MVDWRGPCPALRHVGQTILLKTRPSLYLWYHAKVVTRGNKRVVAVELAFLFFVVVVVTS